MVMGVFLGWGDKNFLKLIVVMVAQFCEHTEHTFFSLFVLGNDIYSEKKKQKNDRCLSHGCLPFPAISLQPHKD